MKFKLGSGKLSIANLLAGMLFAKFLGLLGFYWLQKSLGLNINASTVISRTAELLIFLGLVASVYSPKHIPLYAIFRPNSSRRTVLDICGILMAVIIIAAISRYAIEIIIIAVTLMFDPLLLEDFRKITQAAGASSIFVNLSSGKVMSQLTIVPAVEEIIYRGVLLNYLLLRFRFAQANIASSIIFAIFHGNPIAAFLGGLVFGHIYLRTGNLIYCMIAHCIANATVILLYQFSASFLPLFNEDIASSTTLITSYCIAFAWLLIVSVLTFKQLDRSAASAFR
jgi:membrane protease YdiL (CAAX protease family)